MKAVQRASRAVRARLAPASEGPSATKLGVNPAPEHLSLLLNSAFYLRNNPDVAAAGVSPIEHFLTTGYQEERQPGPLFDPNWYRATYPKAVGALNPLTEFLTKGAFEGRNPIPFGFDSAWYLETYPEVKAAGINPLIHYLSQGAKLGYAPSSDFNHRLYSKENPAEHTANDNPLTNYLSTITDSTANYLKQNNQVLPPLRVAPGPDIRRVNLMLEGFDPTNLYGEPATAITLAAFWAAQTGRALRVVSWGQMPDAGAIRQICARASISANLELTVAQTSANRNEPLPVGPADVFLTTSWQTTQATLGTIAANRVVYLVQADEAAAYPLGSQALAAKAQLTNPDIQVIVGSHALLQHLADDVVAPLGSDTAAFEPSFRNTYEKHGPGESKEKRLVLFASPNQPEQLFELGFAAINQAIELGYLDTKEWSIWLVGAGVPQLELCDGSLPTVLGSVGIDLDSNLLTATTIAVCLSASAHPGFAALDFATAGSLVVTNSWPGKPNLSELSDRIIVAAPNANAVASAIKSAITLNSAINLHDDKANDRLPGQTEAPTSPDSAWFADWETNLSPVVAALEQAYQNA